MSAADSSQVSSIQIVLRSGSLVVVPVVGTAKIVIEKLMAELQGTSESYPPGTFKPESENIMIENGYMLTSHKAGQHEVSAHDLDSIYQHEPSTETKPDVEMSMESSEQTLDQPGPAGPAASQFKELTTEAESQIAALQIRNRDLEQALQQVSEEKADLVARSNQVSQERDGFIRQLQANQVKIRRLNDMIIGSRQTSDEPLDDEVLQDMFKIRNMATEIFKKFYPDDVRYHSAHADGLAKRLGPYYSHYYKHRIHPDTRPERRRRLLISLLFTELQNLFFGPDARRYGVPDEMEWQLQQFEKQIEASNRFDTEQVVEWRTRTVSYARRLNLDYRETINKCTSRLALILNPLALPGEGKHGKPDRGQVAKLENALFELCGAAMQLALRFRSSKTRYEFKSYADNTSVAACDEDLIKKLDVEGPVSKPLDANKLHIFCTLFGALVKTRPAVSGEPGEVVVLERGLIIVYEPVVRGPQ